MGGVSQGDSPRVQPRLPPGVRHDGEKEHRVHPAARQPARPAHLQRLRHALRPDDLPEIREWLSSDVPADALAAFAGLIGDFLAAPVD